MENDVKTDEQNGKFQYDVRRFVDNEDWSGLTEHMQNRIAEDGEKNKKATEDRIANVIEEKFTTLLEKIPVDRKNIHQETQEDKPGGKAGFKNPGDFMAAVTKEGRYNPIPNDPRLKALSEGTGADGGYTVPPDFFSLMEVDIVESGVLRSSGATVIPVSGDILKLPIPNDSDHSSYLYGGMIAYWKAEAAALTEASAKINEVQIPIHKLTGFSYASNELLEDNAVGMGSWLTSKWGKAIAWYEDKAFFSGTGVGEPLGILNSGATKSATRSGASAVTLGDVADMLIWLYATSVGNATWFINPRVLSELVQMTASNAIWIDSNMGATKAPPMAIFGMPAKVTEHCKYLNTAGDIILADPSYYIVGDKPGVRVAVSTEYRFANDQTTYRVVNRVGGSSAVDAGTTLQDGTGTAHPFVTLAAG